MNSHLFQTLPVGSLFFRDPFNYLENPSIKVDDNHARNPKGNLIEVNGGVLVFTASAEPSVISEEEIALAVEIIAKMEECSQ